MASPCRIRLAGLPPARAQALAEAAIDEVRRIEALWSRFRADSVVSRINAAAGGAAVAVDAETAGLLDYASLVYAQTDGAFDLSSGVLRRAWDFRQAALPSAGQVAALLPLIGWSQVQWDGRQIRLPRPGMEIDFGGLGKEYAVDRASALLLAGGARSGLVNLGGDLRVLGPRIDGRPWRLGVAHPREPDAVAFDWPLAEGGLATSGDYERCIVVDGRRHGHILDPRTGWPVDHWQSISIAAPACLPAGVLATAAIVLGPRAPALLQAQGLPWVGIDANGRLHDHRILGRPGAPGIGSSA